jgi:hypothetical protein
MSIISSINEVVEELKKNQYGAIIKKTKKNMKIIISIKFPKEILNKEVSDISIEFLLEIDLSKPKSPPKLYCISPYCSPHFADGRDIFDELPTSKNPKKTFFFGNILTEILEFIKENFQKGCLYFFGNYYLGSRYDLKMFQKGENMIYNARENVVINGKFLSQNRVIIMSDVYFLMFEQEKWYKNNLTLLFWSSISNIQKIQKVKDNKSLILHWNQKEKEPYAMNITLNQRDDFNEVLLEKMKLFGMVFDIKKLEPNINPTTATKKKEAKLIQSQNVRLINNEEEEGDEYNEEEEEEDDEEEEEEEDDDNEEENEKKDKDGNNDKKKNENIKEKKEENSEIKDKKEEKKEEENNEIKDKKEEEKKEEEKKEEEKEEKKEEKNGGEDITQNNNEQKEEINNNINDIKNENKVNKEEAKNEGDDIVENNNEPKEGNNIIINDKKDENEENKEEKKVEEKENSENNGNMMQPKENIQDNNDNIIQPKENTDNMETKEEKKESNNPEENNDKI